MQSHVFAVQPWQTLSSAWVSLKFRGSCWNLSPISELLWAPCCQIDCFWQVLKRTMLLPQLRPKRLAAQWRIFSPLAWLAQFECNSVSPGRMLTLLPACGFVPAGGSTPAEGEREPGTKQMFHLWKPPAVFVLCRMIFLLRFICLQDSRQW